MCEFVRLSVQQPVIDVRTPAEFAAGHIPGAKNLPLFSNDERALIGTTYAEEGRTNATRKGLELIGPRMNAMLDAVKEITRPGPVQVHCWRGGMRSESVAWLLNFSGEFEAYTLEGGYKAFRRFVLEQFARERRLAVLGGLTGTGKTLVLHELARLGEQVVDLEGLANHKGSAFGSIGLSDQPTQQQFENDLAVSVFLTDPGKRLWLEDESRRIGRCMLPGALWDLMRASHCLVIERPDDARRDHLISDYGKADPEPLVNAIRRIERRLGGLAAQRAVASVQSRDLAEACDILLEYYDKSYRYGLSRREASKVHHLDVGTSSPAMAAEALVSRADELAV